MKQEYSDFLGIVSTRSPNLIKPTEAQTAEYCDVIDGILETAWGRTPILQLSGLVVTIYDWALLDSSHRTVVFTTTNIYQVEYIGGVWTPTIITPAGYGISTERAWWVTYATLPNVLVATNGTDPPVEWTGAGLMTLLPLPATVSRAGFCLWWKQRLHLFNVTQEGQFVPYRHWWSEPFKHNLWNTTLGAGFLDYTRGGEPIEGVADLENTLLVFKRNRVVTVQHTGISTVPFANRELDTVRGTIAPFSIQPTPHGVFYLAQDGLRLFTGTESVLVSKHVDAFTAVGPTTAATATSIIDPIWRRYLVAFPSRQGVGNDVVWVVLYQNWPEKRMEYTSRSHGGAPIRSFGRVLASQSFRWVDFGAEERWVDVTMAWNDPQLLGEFETIVAGGYFGETWAFEATGSELGEPVPMKWVSGVLPDREVGVEITRLLAVSLHCQPSAGSSLLLEVLDAETGHAMFQTVLDLADPDDRTHIVYPNRSFGAGFQLRLSNFSVNSHPIIDAFGIWTIDGPDFRR